MAKLIDLTGQRFERLLVVKRSGYIGERTSWECICDCGEKVNITSNALKSKNTKSCGCYSYEQLMNRITTHGKSNIPEYRIWQGIIDRCINSNNYSYHNYGGRGVGVCCR